MDNRPESKGLPSFGGRLKGHLGSPLDAETEAGLFSKDNFQTNISFRVNL
jgi:hypothetical protein